jgi:hypothetical protein
LFVAKNAAKSVTRMRMTTITSVKYARLSDHDETIMSVMNEKSAANQETMKVRTTSSFVAV